MSWLEEEYVRKLGSRVVGFKKVGDSSYNFRCPKCGDSKKNLHKARGYVYKKQDKFWFFCHNGCQGSSFLNFLKEVYPDLYDQYSFDTISKKAPPVCEEVQPTFKRKFVQEPMLKGAVKVS